MVVTPSQRLTQMGVTLPPVPAPVGAYVPAVRHDTLIRTTGQLALQDGRLVALGAVGGDVDVATGARAARVAALNAVAAAAETAGGLDRIVQVIGLVVHIACPPDFSEHPAVADGASELLVEIFGDAGRHIRTNVGSSALPLGSPVEVELTVVVGDHTT